MIPPHSKDASMKQHIEDCIASGLSQSRYCRQHDIPSHIFSYYRKKLGYVKPKTDSNNHQLIPIDLVVKPLNCEQIKITHSNGFSVEINSATELTHIKPVLELLRSIS